MRERGCLMSGAAARTGRYKRKYEKNIGRYGKCSGFKTNLQHF